jgi:hypothetical protein
MHLKTSQDPAVSQAIIDLAKANHLGNKISHSLMTGVSEFSREFIYEEKPFGHYVINGTDVYLINEPRLVGDQKNLLNGAQTKRTDAPGILMLSTTGVSFIPKEVEILVERERSNED